MFDRSNFDRTLFNRSSTFDNVEAALRGSGSLTTKLIVQTHLRPFSMTSAGDMDTTAIAKQNMVMEFAGSGKLEVDPNFYLQLKLTSAMIGKGIMIPGIGVKVPIVPFTLGGTGKMTIDSQVYLLQHMKVPLSGSGTLTMPLVLKVYLQSGLEGKGSFVVNDKLTLRMPVTATLNGAGALELRRIGGLNTDTFELENLNLQPGQTIIIDTDELNVFINSILDVDKVTSDSVFFQLQPGENQITFDTDVSHKLSVTMIWNNRWL